MWFRRNTPLHRDTAMPSIPKAMPIHCKNRRPTRDGGSASRRNGFGTNQKYRRL
jgi:hypothetical protein